MNLFKIFIISLISFSSYSQVDIRGVVKDAANMPIEFADVFLTDANNQIISGGITDDKGAFNLTTKQGTYKLTVSFIGYAEWNQNVTLDKDMDLGSIILKADKNQLDEVVVTAKKPLIERKVDRLVFNIENSVAASGGNGLDALRVAPGVRVQNDAISMVGKSSMAVMVDDRLIHLSGDDLIIFLKTLQTDNIKSIEVITNPPAKFDAEGNSGIINVKLKHSDSDYWNVSLNSLYRQTTYPSGTFGGNFNYQKENLSLFTNLSYENGSKRETETEKIFYPTQKWDNNFKNRKIAKIFSSHIGLDYRLSDTWSAGIQYLGNFSRPHSNQYNKSIIKDNISLSIDSIINTIAYDNKKTLSNSYNFHSFIKLDTIGKKISTNFDYFDFRNDLKRSFQTQAITEDFSSTPDGYLSVDNKGIHDLKIYSAKIDVDYPTLWANFSFGGKVYFSKTHYDNKYFDSTAGVPILQPNRSNIFDYDENTQALYFMGNKKLSEKWSIQLGLRIENTQTKGNSITLGEIDRNNYLQLFPTIYILNKTNDASVFSLNYGRRISRPRYNELNPFQVYYSPYSYTQGNPTLTPSFTDNIEFQYAFKNVLFSSLSFSHKSRGRGNPPFFDDDTKIQYLIDLNFYNTDTYNLSEVYIFNKLDWLQTELQGNLFYTTTNFTKDVNISEPKGWGAFVSVNNRFVLNTKKTINGEINFWYQSPQFQDVYKIKGSASLDLGLKFSLLKSKLNIGVFADDVLKTDIERANTKSGNTNYSYSYYNDYRNFRLSVNYRFGATHLKVEKHNFGNEEEKNRIDN
ncbi:TonB-dependent receptor domain-containing protein [Polaribacter cellanae]|uniref:TonB-dependent receptor n=1 Tax=Polaribacter cellanae TaxID=2818493 RepID=A0A975H830_9FLAO|nr:TonB-dependent receptor [Polaribacter cellanae]QTE23609.1 TonB-dependent receptor [Polaribacter cellanae]